MKRIRTMRRRPTKRITGLVSAAMCLVLTGMSRQPQNVPGAAGASSEDAVRIEAEYKLAVPDGEADAVWAYLQSRYSSDAEESLFEDVSGEFVTTFSTEEFLDTYYDTPELALLEQNGGIRHRRRYYPDNPDAEKHGRELIQVKLSFDDEGVNRAEIKFPVKYYKSKKTPADFHPLLGIVDRDERPALVDRIASIGISVNDLRPTLTLSQTRRRVYISRDGSAFATITLDHVSVSKWWAKASFDELELELNEIGYTEGTAEERAFMESVNVRMKADLFERFPGLVQNQTPKYNKSFAAIDAQLLSFRSSLRFGMPVEGVALLFLTAGAGVLVLFLRRRRDPFSR